MPRAKQQPVIVCDNSLSLRLVSARSVTPEDRRERCCSSPGWMLVQGLAVPTPLGRDGAAWPQPGHQVFAECIWVIHTVLPCLELVFGHGNSAQSVPQLMDCQAVSAELGLPVPALGPSSCCTSSSLKVFAFTNPKTGVSRICGSPDQIQE